MAEKVENTETVSTSHEEPLQKAPAFEAPSSPGLVNFAAPDDDVESGSSSGVAAPPAEVRDRRKPSAAEAQEDLKAFSRIHMVSLFSFLHRLG